MVEGSGNNALLYVQTMYVHTAAGGDEIFQIFIFTIKTTVFGAEKRLVLRFSVCDYSGDGIRLLWRFF